jgi:hypothetical protein
MQPANTATAERPLAERLEAYRIAEQIVTGVAGPQHEDAVCGEWLPPDLLPASRLLDTEFPPLSFAIVPYFPKAEVTELVGAHGIFKSTAAIGACLSVATGRPWGGALVAPGRAVFITMEDGERTLACRVRAWLDGVPAGQERSDAEYELRERFAYLSREQAQHLALTQTDRNTTTMRAPVLEHLANLLADAELVVLETASRLHDGPEMNEALAVFARAIERVAMDTGAAVAIVRHVSKQAARDQVVDSYAGRGGGALSDAARSVLVMTRDRKQDGDEEADPLAPVRLTHAKSTHAPNGPRIVWTPVVNDHGVYLRPLSHDEELKGDARRLLAHVAAFGAEGVTRSDLHKNPPPGLSRTGAKAVLDHLEEAGRITCSQEVRGRNKQLATVYRVSPVTP